MATSSLCPSLPLKSWTDDSDSDAPSAPPPRSNGQQSTTEPQGEDHDSTSAPTTPAKKKRPRRRGQSHKDKRRERAFSAGNQGAASYDTALPPHAHFDYAYLPQSPTLGPPSSGSLLSPPTLGSALSEPAALDASTGIVRPEKCLSWLKVLSGGVSPTPRNCHSCTKVGDELFIFGGYGGNRCWSNVSVLNIVRMTWVHRGGSGPFSPGSRYAHSATPFKKAIYVFGGLRDYTYFNDFRRLDTMSMEWSLPEATGQVPSPRAAHTAVSWKNVMVVFGGNNGEERYNDVYTLNYETMTWTAAETTGEAPSPRAGHSATVCGDKMYIYGGGNIADTFDDMFELDLVSMTWRAIEPQGDYPGVRAGHNVAVSEDGRGIYLFGGGDTRMMYSDLFYFDIDTEAWTRCNVSGSPASRAGHSMVLVGTKLFMFGGGDVSRMFNDLFVLETEPSDEPWGVGSHPANYIFVDALEQKLQQRTSKADLVHRGILKERQVAPSLQSISAELERRKNMDQLTSLLQRRPAKAELVQQRIMESSPSSEPTEEGASLGMRHRAVDVLTNHLRHRPSKVELQSHNIYPPDWGSLAPALHARQIALQRSQTTDQLAAKLQARPPMEQLMEQHIMPHQQKSPLSYRAAPSSDADGTIADQHSVCDEAILHQLEASRLHVRQTRLEVREREARRQKEIEELCAVLARMQDVWREETQSTLDSLDRLETNLQVAVRDLHSQYDAAVTRNRGPGAGADSQK